MSELEHHLYPDRWPVGGWTVSREWPGEIPRPTFADDLEGWNEHGDLEGGDAFSAAPKDAQTYWLGTTATVPDGLEGERVTLRLHTDAESMVYVDGQPWQALDENRGHLVLSQSGESGRAYRIDVMLFSARDRKPKSLTAEWARVDLEVESYRFDLVAILGVAKTLDDDLTASRLRQALVTSTNAIDFHGDYGTVDVSQAARVLEAEVAALRERVPARDADVWLVGNSHIDVAWLWTLAETRAKMGRTTATALRYLDELPAYRFAQSQPQLYEYLRQDFPDLFERVKERVAQGRWEIVGAAWVEPDCNITSGESLVRQILHGQRFWHEHFGRTSNVMWLPDTFGYAWAMPQILRKSGIETFVTQKLTWNSQNTFPYGHFDWQGVDGTRVRCTFPQIYVARVLPEEIDRHYKRIPETDTVASLLYLYGWGDGGGGPVREDIEVGERLGAVPGFPRCTFATAADALESIRVEADGLVEKTGRDVPVWKGELYLESHRGTLTTHARVKKANRDCEQRLREAEIWASVATAQTSYDYPTADLDAAWKHVLLNQFHDIVPGTSIAPVYDGAHARYAQVLATTDRVLEDALSALFEDADAQTLTVTNSLAHPVTDWVEVDHEPEAYVLEADGTPVPCQRTHDGRLGFEATVPALGSATFVLEAGSPDARPDLEAEPQSLASDRFRLTFGDDGAVTSLWDADLDREWLSGPANVFQTFDDRPNAYEAWDVDEWYAEKPLGLFSLRSSDVLEVGPVRAVVRQVHETPAGSRITQDVIVYRTLPRVDFDTTVDWQERRVLLKAAFPIAVHAAHAAYEIQFGTIERPTNRNTTWEQARFEVAAHKWTDVSEGGGGVSLLNDSKYGHDVLDDVMRITLLRNPVVPDPRMPWQEFGLPGREDEVTYTDTGEHRFRYALLPHAGDWRAGTVHHARAFNSPLRVTVGARAASRHVLSVAEGTAGISVEGVK
ncbi:alpha-mannosidase, partial [Rubrivirga sp.]|uniref:alpha-mannosidase n=1 Tax=Rubrivirga sp. TaxID=1885344 RepID=UPI003C72BED2